MTAQNPEALRLADKYEVEGFLQDHRFAQNEWCNQAAVELRRLHAVNVECMEWNEAARQDILSLRAQVQELEAQLESIGAGGVESLRRCDHFRDAAKLMQAARQSLEALEAAVSSDRPYHRKSKAAIADLREALGARKQKSQ